QSRTERVSMKSNAMRGEPRARRLEPRARQSPRGSSRWDSCAALSALFDHLIRPQQQRLRDRQAKRLGRLQINHQLELGRLLDGQVGGLGALEDLIDIDRGAAEQLTEANRV